MALAATAAAEPTASAVAAASGSAAQGRQVFVGWYDASTGTGDVQALDSPAATHPRWSAAAQLQGMSPTSRTLVSAGAERNSAGWNALADQYGALPLGAVRNANLWFLAGRAGAAPRRAMVYAGASDGLLHGFAADDGSEQLAYAPRRLQGRAGAGSVSVDGPVFGGEAPVGPQGELRSLLIAGLGAGGRGFVVLDVSAPDRFASARAADLVVADTTDGADADIGQLHAPAVLDDADTNRARHVVQMANGRWALVIGNGYFSGAGRPVLLVQYLDRSRELLRLSPCMAGAPCIDAGNNGLAMPRLLDTDGDGRVDLAYAGDLRGQLWRFDLGGAESSWRANRIFSACDAQGRRQPITTAPYALPHPSGGWMLVLGTGRHLQNQDGPMTDTQSLYGLHDRGPSDPLQPDEAGCRRPDTLVALAYGEATAVQGTDYHTIRSMAQTDRAQQRGWWVDLPHAGQRVLHNPQAFEGYKLLVRSVVPAGGAQQPRTAGRAWLSVLNMLTGLAPAQTPFVLTDTTLQPQPFAMSDAADGPALLVRRPGEAWLRFANGTQLTLRTGTTVGARAGWREQP
ncbi:pilus assembly protein [Pseudorhodoferax sp. Leaf274]|uniref:pilus assembly protein n=1 Tax=Pseudorhodoferax sp. Leaf274 TaxID=1736318 RepID=UPI00138F9CBA|nr:PilC/PilY family type IV pilus protein [Pseudorhodoferax sp. Leaf274]